MKVFRPGFICRVEEKRKTVAWADENLELNSKLERKSLKSSQLPLFCLMDDLEQSSAPISQFEYDESVINFETFYTLDLPIPSDFSQSLMFTPSNFSDFVNLHSFKPRSLLISSISLIVKKSLLPQLSELKQQKSHTKFTASKFKKTQKNYLKQKKNIEMNLRAEYNLLVEKEKLQELIRANRPFLNVGFTGVKSSKHAVCVEKQKKRDLKSQIEEKTHALEIQMGMSSTIWEKNLKAMSFRALKTITTYCQGVQVLVQKARTMSLAPLVFYLFAAWTSFTKLRKEKKTCIQLAKSAVNLFKVLKILKAWKTRADRPKQLQKFLLDVQDYMKLRRISRLFISWRWFKAYQRLKTSMKVLSRKFYREKVKIKKFFELKTEVSLIKGSRQRFQSLAKGEDSEFQRDVLVYESRLGYSQCLRKLVASLSRYKQEIFLQAQESLRVQQIITRCQFYGQACSSWSCFLMKKSGRFQGLAEYSDLGQKSPKLKSIFTQSATSFTRGNIIWSFPKAKRFKAMDVPTKDVPLIDLGSTLSKSAAHIGYGSRYIFRPIETPAPAISHRELKTSHSKFLQTSPSVPFNRESWDTHKDIPGPGSYELEASLGKTSRGVMIKSRNKPLDPVKDNPGPDYYFPNNGSVQQSRFSAIAFGTSKRYDFTKMAQARNPGPGSYEILSVFEKRTKEFKSRNDLKQERARIESQLISNS